MEYKNRLIQFNDRKQYAMEADFLLRLMCIQPHEYVLDYGCGTGRLTRHIRKNHTPHCFGYDVNNYREIDDPHIFRDNYDMKFHRIFFMHSFAHIPMVNGLLKTTINDMLFPGGTIHIMTPNILYLKNLIQNPDYKPDETVIKHFEPFELAKLLHDAGFGIMEMAGWGRVEQGHFERIYISGIKQ